MYRNYCYFFHGHNIWYAMHFTSFPQQLIWKTLWIILRCSSSLSCRTQIRLQTEPISTEGHSFDRPSCFNIISIPVRCEHIVGAFWALCLRFVSLMSHLSKSRKKFETFDMDQFDSFFKTANFRNSNVSLKCESVCPPSACSPRCSFPPTQSISFALSHSQPLSLSLSVSPITDATRPASMRVWSHFSSASELFQGT